MTISTPFIALLWFGQEFSLLQFLCLLCVHIVHLPLFVLRMVLEPERLSVEKIVVVLVDFFEVVSVLCGVPSRGSRFVLVPQGWLREVAGF